MFLHCSLLLVSAKYVIFNFTLLGKLRFVETKVHFNLLIVTKVKSFIYLPLAMVSKWKCSFFGINIYLFFSHVIEVLMFKKYVCYSGYKKSLKMMGFLRMPCIDYYCKAGW